MKWVPFNRGYIRQLSRKSHKNLRLRRGGWRKFFTLNIFPDYIFYQKQTRSDESIIRNRWGLTYEYLFLLAIVVIQDI